MKSTRDCTNRDCTNPVIILGSLCLFLSSLELMLPRPLPFLRIGLANAALLFALKLPPRMYVEVLMTKVLAGALISGTLFSYIFLFSLAGSSTSGAAMYLLEKINRGKRRISFIGISIMGAFVFNVTQLGCAYFFVLGRSVIYISVPLLACGIVTGTLLGLFCEKFASESKWYQEMCTSREAPPPLAGGGRGEAACTFLIPIASILIFLLIDSVLIKTALFAVSWLLLIIIKKKVKALPTALVFAGIVLFNLLTPSGEVVFKIGSFAITDGALLTGINKAVTVEGLIMISRLTLRRGMKLPGKTGVQISASFDMLDFLISQKHKIRAKTFIKDIDAVLLRARDGV